MSGRKIAVFGGSFNPFGAHHRIVVELLLGHFDLVIILICGFRPDKQSTNDIHPLHRAAGVDLSLAGLPADKVRVEYFDLENDTFTRNHEFEAIFGHEGELWHVVGADLIEKGATKESSIHQVWQHAESVWNTLNFAVVNRAGYPLDEKDLPPHHVVLTTERLNKEASSESIRRRIFEGDSVEGLMVPAAEEYVIRHRLYRGSEPLKVSNIELTDPRPILFVDTNNPRAVAAAEPFLKYEDRETPNLGLVFGGDGTMIRATDALWRRRIPLLGINYGGLGYNLNNLPEPFGPDIMAQPLRVWHLPLLAVEMLKTDGTTVSGFGYNDAWVVADVARTGQAARMEVLVKGVVHEPKVMGDGMLVCTAQGSTAYAKSMGAQRLRYQSNEFMLVGNHVFSPESFKPALLDLRDKVTVRALPESLERVGPLYGHIDGRIKAGEVTEMSARISKFASIELAFLPGQDPDDKLGRAQFPNKAIS